MKQIVLNNISTTYYITEDGKCYNTITGRFLKGQINYKNQYLSYNLTMPDGSMKRCYAHRLVAQAYIPNPLNKKEVNHLDGNKQNNHVDNLEWVTSAENKQHALTHGLRTFKHVFCFTKDKVCVAEYIDIAAAAKATNLSYSTIFQELNKPIKALSGGFFWSYDNILGETITYENTGKAKRVNQYDKNNKFIMSYPSTGTAARALGCGSQHIGECCRGKIKSYKGYIWRYAEDIVSTSDESQSAEQPQ